METLSDPSQYAPTDGAAPPSRTPVTPYGRDGVGAAGLEPSAALYDLHATRIFSLAMRIVRNVGTAEDVVQEVFLQAWTQRHRYDRARGSVLTWLLMMTRTRAIDRLRASRRAGDHPPVWLDGSSVAAPALPDVDDIRVVRDALLMLPMDHRRLVELAFYEGYTHSEIAVIMKLPLGTVKTRIRRGILLLRTAIASCRPERPLGTPATGTGCPPAIG